MDELWHLLVGSVCVLCRESLQWANARRQLCRFCVADLPWLAQSDREDLPLGLSRVIAPLDYTDAPRTWVLQAKRESGLIAARVLGSLLADTVLAAYPFPSQRPDALVPVPLSRRRLMGRGHNQSLLIAAPVSRDLGIPILRYGIRRVRNTIIQPGLDPAARLANVQHAFHIGRPVLGQRLAIIDDVVTTGATASALALVLLDAGAVEVELWSATAARTSTSDLST